MVAAVHHLPLFMAAAQPINLKPRPDMLFVATSSASRGRRAGVLAASSASAPVAGKPVAGCRLPVAGCMSHVALAAPGLSALLAASAPAFLALRWVGAACLLWMSLSMWRVRESAAAGSDIDSPVSNVFWQGYWTIALNPRN